MSKIPILMYHDVSSGNGRHLTISVEMLEQQFGYLVERGYTTIHLRELLEASALPHGKYITITFDDAYYSQMELVLPLLDKYRLKASFFVPLGFLGKTDLWNTSSAKIMTLEQLKSLNPDIIELGYHSFAHKKYSELSMDEIEADISQSLSYVEEHDLNFIPVLAYPYGRYPKEKAVQKKFNEVLQAHGMKLGLRIGNRVNRFPFKKPFEVERIDIKGEWSLLKFKHKVRFGKFF